LEYCRLNCVVSRVDHVIYSIDGDGERNVELADGCVVGYEVGCGYGTEDFRVEEVSVDIGDRDGLSVRMSRIAGIQREN
jgi:hypothetical protein